MWQFLHSNKTKHQQQLSQSTLKDAGAHTGEDPLGLKCSCGCHADNRQANIQKLNVEMKAFKKRIKAE